MSTKPFTVAHLDGQRHHFLKLESAVEFAAKQARSALRTPTWTVRLNHSLTGRVLVNRCGQFEALFDGTTKATGRLVGPKGTSVLFTSMTDERPQRAALGLKY
jgi:hypothetical protein